MRLPVKIPTIKPKFRLPIQLVTPVLSACEALLDRRGNFLEIAFTNS